MAHAPNPSEGSSSATVDTATPPAETKQIRALNDSPESLLSGIDDAMLFLDRQLRVRESEEPRSFLLKVSDALRPVADPISVQGSACRLLGEYLKVDRVCYCCPGIADGENAKPPCIC